MVGDSFGLHHSTVSQLTWRPWKKEVFQLLWCDQRITNIQTTYILVMMCLPSSDPASEVWLDHEKNKAWSCKLFWTLKCGSDT
ncbi:hypothetical protein GQ457_04G028180 [Hibiscus cannabinus]